MVDNILAVIISGAKDYLIDLGIISKNVSDRVLNKATSTVRQSIFESLQDYSKQGSSKLDEKLEKLKKQPIV